jgi:hypothetical protein
MLPAGMQPIPDRSEQPTHYKADHGSDNDQGNCRPEVEGRDRIWWLNEVQPEDPVDYQLGQAHSYQHCPYQMPQANE